MNIRMVLLASAAAFAASTPVLAADAIVAAEPEAVEYVRVCDAYGTGYFYIPGTETCLKINGYIRFQTNWDDGDDTDGSDDWDAVTRGQLQFTVKSDTEYGPLTGVIALRFNADNASSVAALLDAGYMEIAGFRAGLFYSWWDDDLSGETDTLSSFATSHNSIRYQYENGDFYAGLSVDELEDSIKSLEGPGKDNDVGVAFGIGGKAGAFSYQVIGGYDTEAEDGAIRAIAYIDAGPGTIGLAGIYASGPNSYYAESEWTVAAEYAIKATDKLTITPAAQYFGNYGIASDNDFGNDNAWAAGVTLDYKIVDNLATKITVNYTKVEDGDDQTTGFFRLQRSF